MSTLCKLDPQVRQLRTDRMVQLLTMQKHLGIAETLCKQGRRTMEHKDWKHYSPPAQFKHERLLKEMVVRRTVLAMTLKHIKGICRSSYRTGARKEEILNKLGGT